MRRPRHQGRRGTREASRVALVGPEIEENLGLRYLASSLTRAGFASDIVPFNAGRDLPWALEAILDGNRPRLVALSLAFQWRAADVLALAIALREHGFEGHLTAGGHYGTFESEAILRDFPELDSVCRFEAEASLPRLLAAVDRGEDLRCVPGLAYRSNGSIKANPAAPPPERLSGSSGWRCGAFMPGTSRAAPWRTG